MKRGRQIAHVSQAEAGCHGIKSSIASRDPISIRLHAQHVQICAANLREWATQARETALALSSGPNAGAAAQLLDLATRISIGFDANGDGQIAPVPGEGGGLVAYVHAQYLAGLVPALKAAGAEGIIEYPLNKVVY